VVKKGFMKRRGKKKSNKVNNSEVGVLMKPHALLSFSDFLRLKHRVYMIDGEYIRSVLLQYSFASIAKAIV
jgi:hypothetical protein